MTGVLHARGFSWVVWAERLNALARDELAATGNPQPSSGRLYDVLAPGQRLGNDPDLRYLRMVAGEHPQGNALEALHDQDLADLTARDTHDDADLAAGQTRNRRSISWGRCS